MDHNLTPDQMIELVNKGKAWMQAMHEAKRTLKAKLPDVEDVSDPAHWPT